MATLTMTEYRRSLAALAEALSEPGRRFSPDQAMLKGHELDPGRYGTLSEPLDLYNLLDDSVLSDLVLEVFIYGQSRAELSA